MIDSYINKFQRLFVLVINILKRRGVMLFIDGLAEPLKG